MFSALALRPRQPKDTNVFFLSSLLFICERFVTSYSDPLPTKGAAPLNAAMFLQVSMFYDEFCCIMSSAGSVFVLDARADQSICLLPPWHLSEWPPGNTVSWSLVNFRSVSLRPRLRVSLIMVGLLSLI